MLRPAEVMSLLASDIRLGADRAIVRVRLPKAGQRRGVEEVVVVRGATVLRMLRALLATRAGPEAAANPLSGRRTGPHVAGQDTV